MADLISFDSGDYRYLPSVFQYSGAVEPLAGFEIERVRFRKPVPMAEGARAIEEHLKRVQRPTTALCACELRSPAPFSEAGFYEFNREYVQLLERWGLFVDERNPVARTNICPEVNPPASVSLHAFSYTAPRASPLDKTFVISGSGEVPEGRGNYQDHVIRPGDSSPDGLREKAVWVLNEMERRMAALSRSWVHATAVSLYTVHDIHHVVRPEIASRGAMACGLEWHFARPPVADLDYEMDVRAVSRDSIVV